MVIALFADDDGIRPAALSAGDFKIVFVFCQACAAAARKDAAAAASKFETNLRLMANPWNVRKGR